ncbi:uncharacterized protein LOC128879892 [Hylaeus volcanicus]|uniref:uncharacterized protein LOC128879892 n=1 Tax=Hylaeus volcanicus TaxID=313075 RepID=UPI0023B7A309|nr:uncharacterized protein LOC128879892 [Hylaeus volcanicus]
MTPRSAILFCIVCICSVQSVPSRPEAIAPTGKIRGSILNSRLGRKIYSFRGVRYAEPPTGDRRFKVAIPAADRNDVFDASEEGPSCPNLDGVSLMSEDCLRLNVYTTKLPSKDENVSRPVLVFFHPGGFYSFSGQSFYFGPQYLMDKNIVLVTVNYRIGTLGFISTGDSAAPGNLGLKDQVLALRWIRRNIIAFGGNPNSVTISGYSVGGLSTMLHMLSPMSKDLFHRAIVMSGSLLTTEPYPTEQKRLAKKQAELLDCPTSDNEAMLTCLRSKPVSNFTDTMSEFFEWHGDPILIWEPVVEPKIPGVEQFLPAQPVDLIRQKKFHQVPAIFGVTKDEFGGVVAVFENVTKKGDDYYRDMSDNWDRIAPICFLYERGTPRSKYISDQLRQFYFNGQPLGPANNDGLAHIYADSVIIFPMYRTAKLIAENSDKPVYFYEFTFQGRYSFVYWNATTPYGVVHHDDLQYLFFMKEFFPFLDSSAPEIPMVELYTSMWTNFVETGEPVPKTGAYKNVRWDRFVSRQDNYLEINLNPTMRTGLYLNRMQEWEKLFPLLPVAQAIEHVSGTISRSRERRRRKERVSSSKMKTTLIVLSCVVGIIATRNSPREQPLVTAPTGPIRGSILTSRLGKDIYSFRGVRYAEPPTGHQRFQPPVPAADWQNVYDATEDGPACPQNGENYTSEDCLLLNVYTTKLPCKDENVSRPVMVFLHPGGFYAFSGRSTLFGPQYLMDQDIVLVTINYRLGALGFLSMGDNLAPGNMGLKDQVVALRWVQRNIAAFGGNPNAVTLCGDSAGSFSILLHMVSPMSQNLFHRAISMSGSPLQGDVYSNIASNGQKQLAKKLADLLNCPSDTTGSMLLCMYTKPVENFTDTLASLFDWYQTPILLWQPTVEPEVRGVERFLTAQPYDLISQGKFKQVPYILGVTEDEFGGLASLYEKDALNNGSLYQEINDNWNRVAPILFYYERDTPRSNYISRELRRFYFNNQPIDSNTMQGLSEVYADGIIIFSMYRTAKLMASKSKQPVYFYKFTYKSRYSFRMWNDTTPAAVDHQDDLQYLFYMKQLFPYFEPDAPEIPMVEVSTSMWANFVETGEPIPRNNDRFRGVTWTPFVPAQTNFLDINPHPTMKNSFFPERMQFWERLFPLPNKSRNVKH